MHTAEVKDKVFSARDVHHAVSKVAKAGRNSLKFIIGPRAKLKDSTPEAVVNAARKKRTDLTFLELSEFLHTAVALAPARLRLEVVEARLRKFATKARMKPETMQYLVSALRTLDRAKSGTTHPHRRNLA